MVKVLLFPLVLLGLGGLSTPTSGRQVAPRMIGLCGSFQRSQVKRKECRTGTLKHCQTTKKESHN